MKLLELYKEKVMERKEKQKENIKKYMKSARMNKIAEKLLPYKDEVIQLVEAHGAEEARKIVNTSLGMKVRSSIFNEVIHYLKQPQEPQKQKKQKK